MLSSLDDALDVCRGSIVNVEIKADVPRRRRLVAEVARVVGRARSVDVLVSSFDPFVVAASAAAAPGVRRGILVGKRTPRLAVALPYAMRAAVSCAHLEDSLHTRERVSRLERVGLELVAWTVNDEARARALVAMGVKTIITDRPAAIVAALRG
jgi:glycerophosphoryl diester phosphodiesterase